VSARIRVRVHPGARRERVTRRMDDGSWRIEVQASPADGRANDAVIRLLAEVLEVKRSDVRVVTGHAARAKVVEIEGLEGAEAEARLGRAAAR